MIYAITTLYCLSVSLSNGGAGIGADVNEALLRKFAAQAGFSRFRVLPMTGPGNGLFELRD